MLNADLECVGRLLQPLERPEDGLHAGQQLILLCGNQVRAGALAQLLPDPAQVMNMQIIYFLQALYSVAPSGGWQIFSNLQASCLEHASKR